MIDGLTV